MTLVATSLQKSLGSFFSAAASNWYKNCQAAYRKSNRILRSVFTDERENHEALSIC